MVHEQNVREFVAQSGGKADSVEVDFLGRIHLRNLALPLADGTNLRIAAVDGRLKNLFLSGGIEMNGLNVEVATDKISVARASIEGANVDDDALTELFNSKGAAPVSKRIERFAAKRMSASEVTLTQSIAGREQKTIYKNVALDDIANGRIGRYSIGNASFDIAMDIPDGEGVMRKERMLGSTGAIAGEDFDAAYMARLYTEKAGPGDTEAKPLYGPLSVKAITLSDGKVNFAYDEMRINGFSMRMPAEPLLETVENLKSVTDPEALSPEERQAFFNQILSVVDMIGKGDMQLFGFKVDAPYNEGEDAGKRVKIAVERMALQLDGRKLDAGVHGLSIAEGTDTIKIGEASITGFSWHSPLEALKKMAGLNEQQLETFAFTTLMPELGTIRVAGIEVDVANPETVSATEKESADVQVQAKGTDEPTSDPLSSEAAIPGAGQKRGADQPSVESAATVNEPATILVPQRVRFSLKSYEMALTKPHNGIPTDIRLRQEELSVPVPADSKDEAYIQLRKLGFENLVFSYNLAAAWDQPNQNLLIKDISLSGKDMGSLSLSGLMGGFTEEFFSLDTAKTQLALFGLTAREVKLKIEDQGLMAKGIKLYSEQSEMTEDQARAMVTMMATEALQQLAVAQPKFEGAIDALLHFIAAPRTFTLTVRSKAEHGLSVFDLVAASENPMLILDKVDLEATAQ
ncbi:hypothetical protein GGD55_005727 [Rhizobium giardinii]|uniref:DUF748 domain-containing protein n=2 Tax=Rhizobium giardinii TaxID=56731 RepID=A0A7W8XB76_9HYPH|nr:hypothetical protein [Rhizobium giardinii]MBB5538984.1 hypothetical protein [Rhizobium giardinii]